MYVVGLTGGIGSGKSTFAALLVERGAHLIDADLLGREALRPGRPAWHSVVDQFGDEILAAGTMEIDRKRLASIVFSDPEKLAALNAIVHPVIFKGIADALEAISDRDAIVIIDAALIFEAGIDRDLDATIAVVSPRQTRAARLLRERGMSFDESGRRMATQLDTAEVTARSEIVVRNEGSLEALARDAERVWDELLQRARR